MQGAPGMDLVPVTHHTVIDRKPRYTQHTMRGGAAAGLPGWVLQPIALKGWKTHYWGTAVTDSRPPSNIAGRL